MHSLSTELLIECYLKSCELKLDEDFIHLIEKEMSERLITRAEIDLMKSSN